MVEIKRELYLQKLISKKNNGMIKVITGLRRSGKSYLLFNIFKTHLLESGITENQIIEITLDDDESANLRNPLKLSAYIKSRTTEKNLQYYVLIDEIQYCKKIENPDLKGDFITFYNVLNGLLRHENIDTYVTGSNSQMLSSDILTEFRGRGDKIHVYPLSFSEYYPVVKDDLDFEDSFTEYTTYGGLPKTVLLEGDENKSEYLKNLFNEVYIKDILQRHNLKNEEALSNLLSILSSSIGSYTNPSNIEKTFKSVLNATYSSKTIFNHIEFLKDSFLLYEAQRFSIKGRKYIGANSKYYFSDLGLRNAILNFRQIEPTHLMENAIYNELFYRGFNVDVGIVEVNGKNKNGERAKINLEVDFVVNKGNEKFYIQSAFALSDDDKLKQEENSLLKIDDSFKKIIITRDRIKPHYDENGIYIISFKDFFMNLNL